ncbi:hypothetical protein GQX73_g1290 [Xylaria multiplex]|uniref:DUF202 domain-containing protein n=1 Tax=Xylaria multiplex TaxID=323545 RepID=A0A7C8J0Q3_9PEZI|nr:hypothetical protein GQX73_g1290 [Xylaria multiplex]
MPASTPPHTSHIAREQALLVAVLELDVTDVSNNPIPKTASTYDYIVPDRWLVEIRAAQRTFEGAYMRTALSQFSFALIILKIFTSEFYAIGALFAVYGATVMVCAVYRRYEGNRQFFRTTDNDGKISSKFRTCNNSVLLLTVLSLGAYIGLLVLTWNLAT